MKAVDLENQALTGQLSSKISRLKNLAFEIEQDSREDNRLLDGLGGHFSSVGGLLGTSGNRLRGVAASGSQNRRILCYTVAAVVLTFVFFYYVLARIWPRQESNHASVDT